MHQKGRVYVFVKFRSEYVKDGKGCSVEPLRWHSALLGGLTRISEYDPAILGMRVWAVGISQADYCSLDILVDEDTSLADIRHRFRAVEVGVFTPPPDMIELHAISAPVIPHNRFSQPKAVA